MLNFEWPLIFFTLLLQTAVGSITIFFLLIYLGKFRKRAELNQNHKLKILHLVGTLALFSILFSFLHLGSPLKSIFALNNIGSSWLSREILSLLFFTVAVGGYYYMIRFHQSMESAQNIFACLIFIFGWIAVFSMSKIYMLEIIPSWNNIFTPASFGLTTFIMGVTINLIYILVGNKLLTGLHGVLKWLTISLCGLLLIEILLSYFHSVFFITIIMENGVEVIRAASTLLTLSVIRIGFTTFGFVILLVFLYKLILQKALNLKMIFYITLIFIILSQLIGRLLFYSSYITSL